jgi:DUF1365 family protein
MQSCFYEGQVRHRRYSPRAHKFSYRLFYMFLDLDEIDAVFDKRWFWSVKRPAIAWFRRSDYLGDSKTPLKQAVLERIQQTTGKRPEGPVRLLTHLRYFGYVFNPVSFYYCYDKTDSYVETIVAEITNTPWGERHSYVLPVDDQMREKSHMKFDLEKDFHISPFMPMDMKYDWRFTRPNELLTVHMNNYEEYTKVFDATLSLVRKPITAVNCARALTLFPLMTTKVIAGIYWEAFRLFLKRIPFHNHPEKLSEFRGGTREVNQP